MHAVEGIALQTRYASLHAQFEAAYANRGTLWNNTYAATNFYEYFAETAQSFFNDNASGPPGGDGIHNDIDTRAELQAYDPTAYNLLLQIFGDTSWDVGDFFGDAGANTFTGTPYGDLMFGDAGPDGLNGNGGDDRLIGGTENDAMNGGAGLDTLKGGAGPDTFMFDAALSARTVAKVNPNADISPTQGRHDRAGGRSSPMLKLGELKNKAFGAATKKPSKDKHAVYYEREERRALLRRERQEAEAARATCWIATFTRTSTSPATTLSWRERLRQRQRRLVEPVGLPRLHRQDVLDGAERLEVRLRDPAELEFVEAVERALDHRLEEGGQDAEGPVLRVGADAEHAGAADLRHQERHLDEAEDVRRAAGAGERLVHVRHPHHVADELVAAAHGQHQFGDHHAHDAMGEEVELGRGDRREAPHRLADAVAELR